MRLSFGCLILALLLTSACAITDEAHLRAEVASLVKPGDSTNMAMAKMETAKFICTLDGVNDIDCTRDRYTKIIESCLQRVTLLGARDGGVVKSIKISPVLCLGGFG